MKITKKTDLYSPVWISTEDFFGEIDPQPEIKIKPLTWEEKAACREDSTRVQIVPFEGRLEPAARVVPKKFSKLLMFAGIIDLKHFEYEDGSPIKPDNAGIEYLCNELGEDFMAYVIQKIVKLSDDASEKSSQRKGEEIKNS